MRLNSSPFALGRGLMILASAGFFSVAPCLFATTLRVDGASGVDIAGCGTEVTPCASIQKAVNEANSADTILVAAGTYTYDLALDPCPPDLTAVVCIMNMYLTIEGGFGSGNWSNPDPQTNVTTIDGEDANRGVLVVDINSPAGLVMEGFTVRRGLGVASNSDNNAWGGGVFAKVADLTLRNMLIENNIAKGKDTQSGRGGTGAGGGVAVRGNINTRQTAVFENVTCHGNTALGGTGPERGGGGQGGGMWIYYTDATGDQLVFTNNSAIAGDSDGDGVFEGSPGAQGGGVAFKQESVSVFSNVTATGNVVIGGDASPSIGSAGFGFGGGLYGEVATFTVFDAEIAGNSTTGGNADTAGGGYGGGVYALNSTVVLERTNVISNEARGGDGPTKKGTAGGGGCHFSDEEGSAGSRTIRIVNTIISDNVVYLGGGGDETVSGGGGAIFLNGSQAELTHCTVARNSLSTTPMSGRAFVLVTRTPATPVPANMDLNFGIISDHVIPGGNTAAVRVNANSSITFNTGLFANNESDTSGTGTINGLGTMDSAGSVEYVSPGNPDFNYHLQAVSPAVGAAIGSLTPDDFDGELRDASPDLGADEVGGILFSDGFVSGDTTAWSSTVG